VTSRRRVSKEKEWEEEKGGPRRKMKTGQSKGPGYKYSRPRYPYPCLMRGRLGVNKINSTLIRVV